jgi:hypothetical protein
VGTSRGSKDPEASAAVQENEIRGSVNRMIISTCIMRTTQKKNEGTWRLTVIWILLITKREDANEELLSNAEKERMQ